MATEGNIFKFSNAGGFTSRTRYSSMLAGTFIPTGNFESIATVTVGSNSQSTITFSSIPQTYTHLQIRGIARCDRAVTYFTPMIIQFNSDTTSGNYYAYHLLKGDTTNASAYSGSAGSIAGGYAGDVAGGSGTASTFAANIIDILDYSTSGQKYKTVRALCGSEGQSTNSDNEIQFSSSLWKSTSAVTQIELKVNSGNPFVQYTSFALYGVR